jgi:hypothetical protein
MILYNTVNWYIFVGDPYFDNASSDVFKDLVIQWTLVLTGNPLKQGAKGPTVTLTEYYNLRQTYYQASGIYLRMHT